MSEITVGGVTLRRIAANRYNGPCPLCGGGRDRFYVKVLGTRKDGTTRAIWWCRAAHDGRASHKPWGWLDELDGSPRGIRFVPEKPRSHRPLSPRLALQFHGELHRANGFFPSRGITRSWVERLQLGYDPRHHRFTFPVFMSDNHTLLAIDKRRDDETILATMRHKGQEWIEYELNLLRAEWDKDREPTLRDIMERRYSKWVLHPGSRWGIFAAPVLRLESLDYLIIVESKPDAAALLSLGYPAIAVKVYERQDGSYSSAMEPLVKMLQAGTRHIPVIYIVADDDETGMWHAACAARAVGENKATIVRPPDGCSDAGDAIQAGIPVDEWLPALPTLEEERLGKWFV